MNIRMINPATWRRIFKPRYAAMFQRIHAAGMHVWYHSDGRINDILGDLIEIGVDVINCQVPVVGHEWVARNACGQVGPDVPLENVRAMSVAFREYRA